MYDRLTPDKIEGVRKTLICVYRNQLFTNIQTLWRPNDIFSSKSLLLWGFHLINSLFFILQILLN